LGAIVLVVGRKIEIIGDRQTRARAVAHHLLAIVRDLVVVWQRRILVSEPEAAHAAIAGPLLAKIVVTRAITWLSAAALPRAVACSVRAARGTFRYRVGGSGAITAIRCASIEVVRYVGAVCD
jgi:hypothetical protein